MATPSTTYVLGLHFDGIKGSLDKDLAAKLHTSHISPIYGRDGDPCYDFPARIWIPLPVSYRLILYTYPVIILLPI